MKRFQLQGIDKVSRKLGQQIVNSKSNSMRGLIESAIIIRRSMDKEEPKIPVDLGNLRGSWFTTPLHPQIALRIGFTANYATYVHENIEKRKDGDDIHWSRPGSGPKFLEQALERNGKEILKTVAEANKL